MKINLKLIMSLCFFIIIISCLRKQKDIGDAIEIKNFGSLSVVKGYPGLKIIFDTITAKKILMDLKKISEVQGPIKFVKPYKFVIEHKSGTNDTLFTNGNVFQWKDKYYKSEDNLIQKFDIE